MKLKEESFKKDIKNNVKMLVGDGGNGDDINYGAFNSKWQSKKKSEHQIFQ